MRDTDLAYLAGIVDGEGHVLVRRKNVALVLCMADVAILEWCHATFGGTLSGSWKAERGAARPRRMWHLTRRNGLAATAEAMLPFLVLKRREVELLLDAVRYSETNPFPRQRTADGDAARAAWRAGLDAICADAHAALLARK